MILQRSHFSKEIKNEARINNLKAYLLILQRSHFLKEIKNEARI
jgi:hypothetical protein